MSKRFKRCYSKKVNEKETFNCIWGLKMKVAEAEMIMERIKKNSKIILKCLAEIKKNSSNKNILPEVNDNEIKNEDISFSGGNNRSTRISGDRRLCKINTKS